MGLLESLFKFDDSEKKHLENIDKAESLYQVKEYGGELWLTYDGWLVCPSSMLNIEPVEAVKKMRELYVKRNEE